MKSIITTYKSVLNKNCLLSSSLHHEVDINNSNILLLKDLLERELKRSDLGKEVGSINYVNGSNFFFVKTKALQDYSFLPIFNSESTETVSPQSFQNQNLKKGDVILSKDSNIGEVIILDDDYPNYMLSGALYKLPLKETYKYYALAMIKHKYFREQLDKIVPKGATIRHAGTKFLDCMIPFPNNNCESIVSYITQLTKKVIDIEVEIKNKYKIISSIIEEELIKNSTCENSYKYPTYNCLMNLKRLDTGVYSKSFLYIDGLIKNYNNGYFFISADKLRSGNTPKVRQFDTFKNGDVRWVTPTNCSDYGYIENYESIKTTSKCNLTEDSSLFINRTSRGGKGEYVGISTFYDYKSYGNGYHNQGIYRVTGYSKDILIFITCFLNIPIMRKYCSGLSVGSKMKEIKSEQFLSIPIPKFNNQKLTDVVNLFYSGETSFSLKTLKNLDVKKTGLFQLDTARKALKSHINNIIDLIINDVPFDPEKEL